MGYDAQVYGFRVGIDNRVCVRVLVEFCHRHATSKHPIVHMYNDKEEPRTLTYQDANSLYSWAMSQVLPLRGFKLVPNEIDILNVPEDSKLGYILEVDLEYPKELHDKHNLYSLAPEHVEVTDHMLSPFQQENFPSTHGSIQKLGPNLHNKNKYIPESSIVC